MIKIAPTILTTTAILFSSTAFAGKAHEHGVAQLYLAPLEKSLSVTLVSPADGILGFENIPKNDQQKKTQVEAEATLRNKASEFFVLPADLECSWKVDRFFDGSHQKSQSGHRDYLIQWTADCKKPLTGKLSISLGKQFSRIHKLNVSVLKDKNQTSHELKAAQGDVSF
jgi:hypothetical protein